LNTDVNHCGFCGNTCSLSNANSKCVGGECIIAGCKTGFANCDGISSAGCKTNLQTDVGDCGSCGIACNLPKVQTHHCFGRQCHISSCKTGFADCDGTSSADCEVNLNADKHHCGWCGNTCSLANANFECVKGSCVIKNCWGGYGNCDGKLSTGCETNVYTNFNYCGDCNDACAYGDSCANGVCVTFFDPESENMRILGYNYVSKGDCAFYCNVDDDCKSFDWREIANADANGYNCAIQHVKASSATPRSDCTFDGWSYYEMN